MRLVYLIVGLWVSCSFASSVKEQGLTLKRLSAQQIAIDPKPALHSQSLRQAWILIYELRNDSDSPVIFNDPDLEVSIDGWLSNSTVPGHESPAFHTMTLASFSPTVSKAFSSASKPVTCKNQVTFWYSDHESFPIILKPISSDLDPRIRDPLPPLQRINPHGTVKITIQIDHFHDGIGAFEPLIGDYNIVFKLNRGDIKLVDRFNSFNYYHKYNPGRKFDRSIEGVVSYEQFVSAPHSHFLSCTMEVPTLRFSSKVLRPGSRQKLSFYYLIANGGQSPLVLNIAHVQMIKDHHLPPYEDIVDLKEVGHWQYFEKIFTVHPFANSLGISFELNGEIGDAWVDDLKLEPVED